MRPAPSRADRLLKPLWAFALYLVLAAALMRSLLGSLSSVVPHDPGDPLLNVWLLWWNAHNVPFSREWWNGPFFHPISGTLAFSEHIVGLGVLASPLLWLGASPLVAYNVVFLLSFPLCAFSAYLLCRSLTGREDAALVGGLMFGFAPYRIAHLPHLDILSCFWMPLALLGLHRSLESRHSGWLAVFAGSWLLQVLCKGYAFFYFSVLIALWVLWFAPPWREWRTTARIAGAWALAALPLVPVFLEYRAVHERYGFVRERFEIERFSADVASLLDGSPLLAHWRSLFGSGQEAWLFPGLAPLAAVALGLLLARRGEARASGRSMARVVLATAAALAALVALSAVTLGPWRVELAWLTISVRAVEKPLAVAWVFLIATVATSARFVDAARRRSPFAFYTAATVAMWVLALGPEPRAFGVPIWHRAPYSWLLLMPGFDSLRVPARFWMCAIVSLSVAAAIALASVANRLHRGRGLLMAAAAAAVLWDGWIASLPVVSAPSPSRVVVTQAPGSEAILELPVRGLSDAAALYRSIFHRRPLVNGFSGHEPPHYAIFRLGLERREHGVLTALAAHGPLYIVVDRNADTDGSWHRWVAEHPAVRLVASDQSETVYHLPRPAAEASPTTLTQGARIAVQAVRANVNRAAVGQLIDGNLRTRWQTGRPQRRRDRIVMDVGVVQPIEGVVLSLGEFLRDFPRQLRIDLSVDGSHWTEVWAGPTAGLAMSGCLAAPSEVSLRFSLGGRPARFVRLRQTADDPVYHWSLVEIALYGRPWHQ